MDTSVPSIKKDDVGASTKEVPPDSTDAMSTGQPIKKLVSASTCLHGRLIDDVLTHDGIRSGKVRCLECGAVIEDPHHSQR